MSTSILFENFTESESNIPPPPEIPPISDIGEMSTARESINFLSDDLSKGFSWKIDYVTRTPVLQTSPDILEFPPPPTFMEGEDGKIKITYHHAVCQDNGEGIKKGKFTKRTIHFHSENHVGKKEILYTPKILVKGRKSSWRIEKFLY